MQMQCDFVKIKKKIFAFHKNIRKIPKVGKSIHILILLNLNLNEEQRKTKICFTQKTNKVEKSKFFFVFIKIQLFTM